MTFAISNLVLAVLLVGAAPARAWLPEGHMATGAIAYDILARYDPTALDVVRRMMESHPQWPSFRARLTDLAGADRTRRLFELMAVWPDEARGGVFDHDDWHYSQTFVSPIRHLVPQAFGGAEDAYRRNLVIARDPGASDAARAVALCWVIHIVGDMHQSLHAALWLGWRFPTSDAGGNWAWVRAAPGAAPQRLHFFWDAAGRTSGLSRGSPDAFVAQLEAARPFEAEPRIDNAFAAFDGWVRQARIQAFSDVYDEGRFQGGVSAADAPVLTAEYVARARRVGADAIAAAGNRIGALLLRLR